MSKIGKSVDTDCIAELLCDRCPLFCLGRGEQVKDFEDQLITWAKKK